jgi:predicted Zn-dependent protease
MKHRAESKAGPEPCGQKSPEAGELRELRHRLSLAPHNNELRLHLVQWLAERGRRQEALDELRELVHLDPNHLVARKLRAELLHSAGEPASDGTEPPQSSEALH